MVPRSLWIIEGKRKLKMCVDSKQSRVSLFISKIQQESGIEEERQRPNEQKYGYKLFSSHLSTLSLFSPFSCISKIPNTEYKNHEFGSSMILSTERMVFQTGKMGWPSIR